MLPTAFKAHYDRVFLEDFRLCLIIVGWKLAQPEARPLTCVAEELALNAIIQRAETWLDMRGESVPSNEIADLREMAFEDEDFAYLFGSEMAADVMDVDPSGQLGVGYLDFRDWFEPFGDGTDRGVLHPVLWPEERRHCRNTRP